MTLAWDLKLQPTIKLVLLAMCDWSNDAGLCYPSIPTVARKTCISTRHCQRIMSELIDTGLSSEEVAAIGRTIAATPGVDGVRLQSLVLGGESVLEIVSAVPLADLRYALDRRGLRLEGGTLRRRGSGEAALPPPVPEVQEEQLQESPGPEGGA